MKTLNLKTLCLLPLGLGLFASLNAAGVVDYTSSTYDDALTSLETPTTTTDTTTYALTECAVGSDGLTYYYLDSDGNIDYDKAVGIEAITITKYLRDESGNLTAVNYVVSTDSDYSVARQTKLADGSDVISSFVSISPTTTTGGGGAISVETASYSVTVTGDFIYNTSTVNRTGGAIYDNAGTLYATGDFINNTARNSNSTISLLGGGALFVGASGVSYVVGDFIGNSYTAAATTSATNIGGGAVYNRGNGTTIVGDFIGNYVTNTSTSSTAVGGGAVFNYSNTINLTGSFIGNSVDGDSTGGAIYNVSGATVNLNTSTTLSDVTYNSSIYFTGNKDANGSNAIYNAGIVNFNASSGYDIVVNDAISGSAGVLNINSGTTYFNNDVSSQTITVADGATLSLGYYAGTDNLFGVSDNEEGTFVYSSTASLSATSLILNAGATLNIAGSEMLTYVILDSTSSITISAGATMNFAFEASFMSDTGTFASGQFIIDMLDLSTSSFIFATFESSDELNAFLLELGLMDNGSGSESFAEGVVLVASNDGYLTFGEDYTYYIEGTSVGITMMAAVPEPSTYAMIFGLFALGFAYYRKRN